MSVIRREVENFKREIFYAMNKFQRIHAQKVARPLPTLAALMRLLISSVAPLWGYAGQAASCNICLELLQRGVVLRRLKCGHILRFYRIRGHRNHRSSSPVRRPPPMHLLSTSFFGQRFFTKTYRKIRELSTRNLRNAPFRTFSSGPSNSCRYLRNIRVNGRGKRCSTLSHGHGTMGLLRYRGLPTSI